MNRIIQLCLLLALVIGVWQPVSAQRTVGNQIPANLGSLSALTQTGNNRGGNCDTLVNVFSNESPAVYGINGAWGYVQGHNQFGDRAKADFFTNTGSGQVTQAIMGFGRASFGNASNTIRVGVWDDDGVGGAPNTLLGFQDITIASIAANLVNGNFTLVTFNTPVNVNGNFYLGFEIPAYRPNDTVVLATSPPRTSGNTAWEMDVNGIWYPYPASWTNFNTSHWAFPIICAAPAAPVANFSGMPTSISVGGSVNFTDLSSGSPTTWAWSFPGGTPSSSSLQTPPAITYNTPGSYNVSLTVTSANGTDTETKTGYIQVSSGGGGGNTYVDCDTFTNIDFSTATPELYTSNQWGYVSGHNFYLDSSKAEFIGNALPGTPVSGVLMAFEVAAFASPSSAIRVKVWDANGPGGLPGTVLATQSVTISSIAADIAANRFTYVSFTNPATPAGNYYIGISFQYDAGDTVALLTTTDGDVSPTTGYDESRTGVWASYLDGWGLEISHFIFPIQCATLPCPTITATFNSTNPVCTATNGSITATGTGGTAPYTFAWSSGGNTATVSNLAAGSYTVTITDANGCTGTSTTTLTASNPTIAPNITTTPAVCTAVNGSATAAPTGGSAPYTYAWSGGGNTASITNQAAGTYTVTITDANGCSTTGSATIGTSSGNLSLTASATPATCTATDGTATANATGGAAPLTYAWGGGQNTATITGQVAGTYSVTVTDANGCSATATATVGTNNGNLAITTSTTNATCGAATGSATVNITGGTAPTTITWSGGGNTATLPNLVAGTYGVTVTDANGCSATATAVVADPGSPTISIVNQNNVSCFGATDGSVAVNAAGGTGPYTYAWSTGPTTSSISGLAVGTVTVTVTDATTCQATLSINITGPSAALNASVTVNNHVTCAGASNGSLTASATDGTAPYNYAWSSGSLVATANGLAAGTYTVTVTDANGCTVTAVGNITPPSNPATVTVNNAQTTGCGLTDASLTAAPGGGAGPYTYVWGTTPAQNTATATGLGAGIYSVTITDNGGCTATGSGTVTEPGAHTASAVSSPVTCWGGNNGTVVVTPTGGSGNFSYTWNPSAASGNTANNLTAGTYTITVLDNNTGCRAITTATVIQPDTLGIQITQTNVTCPGGNNGVVSVVGTGGNGGYTYTWLTSPQQTGASLTGLTAGAYILQLQDNQGCSRNFTINITQPSAITVSINKNDVTCNGASNGSATVSATGGTGAFSYVWSTTPTQNGPTASSLAAGSYTVTATDANGCTATQSVTIAEPTAITATTTVNNVGCFGGQNGSATVNASGGTGTLSYAWGTSPIQNTATATGLLAGNYTVTVTDANGCTATATAAVSQPSLITVNTTTTPVSCAGGSNGTATATATGGTGTLTYQWPSGSGATVGNLAAGTYTVTVSDANGCTVTGVATVAAASGFTASLSTTPVSCQGTNDGTATVNVVGGASPFTYAWSPSGSGATATGLATGTYNVTVTDANGCTATASGNVGNATNINITATPVSASCNGGTNGAINITVSGGAGNYSYAWSNSTSNQNLTGVGAGTYTVIVTDANGCTATAANLVVSEASAITLTLSATAETATDANDGTATASSTGGTGLIGYSWSNGGTGSNQSNLAPGNYTVTATDANGCTAVGTTTVGEYTGIRNVGLIVSLNLYPNPTEGKVNMSLTLAQPEAVVVEWYNAIGEKVLANSFDSSLTVNHSFDLSNMAAGVYYARIQYAGQMNVQRIVLGK